MLKGQNGILTQAQKADVETRGAAVEEAKDLWENSQKVDEATGSKEAQSLDELLTDLQQQGLLTEDEVATVKSTGSVQIGSRTINFVLTIGTVYTDDMIGQKVTYSSNGQSDWIIFGKDKDGNILLTTAKPIDNIYELYGSAENWLNYENALNAACSGYGATIQEKQVTSRSIKMDDINYASGFDVNKLNFDTYTFGTKIDLDNKQVNYYFPSKNAITTNYWKKAMTSDEEIKLKNDWYSYYLNKETGALQYAYSGGTDLNAEDIINKSKLQYIWGENSENTGFNDYLVASTSIGMGPTDVGFYVAYVGNSRVDTSYVCLCRANSDGGAGYNNLGLFAIRPIVVIPSDIKVEKNESGLYDIAY